MLLTTGPDSKNRSGFGRFLASLTPVIHRP